MENFDHDLDDMGTSFQVSDSDGDVMKIFNK